MHDIKWCKQYVWYCTMIGRTNDVYKISLGDLADGDDRVTPTQLKACKKTIKLLQRGLSVLQGRTQKAPFIVYKYDNYTKDIYDIIDAVLKNLKEGKLK